tara:strand:+ start:437 stop:838 length:402 start_codon:yes stop_codon:yes gene_type:complete
MRSDGGRGCEGSENPGLSIEKEVGRGILSGDNNQGSIGIEDVIEAFETITGYDFRDLLLEKRATAYIIEFKYLYSALARHFRFSFPQIGRSLKRDHTSVVHYLKRHNVLMSKDKAYSNFFKNLCYHAEILLVK